MYRISIPATSANMGPGFDCLGVALSMYNVVHIEEYDGETKIEADDPAFCNKDNLIYTSLLRCLDEIGYHPGGIRIVSNSRIPSSRGLGSSAACIVAGVAGANCIAGGKLSEDEMVKIASELEGHPDNVAPALLGGFVVSFMDQGKVYYEKIEAKSNLKFCALIPDFSLSTSMSRSVLPANVNFKDGVYNIGRACYLVAALQNGNTSALGSAFEDRLHQQYRGKLIDRYDELTSISKELGSLGTFLSGAGPTIMTVVAHDNTIYEQKLQDYLNENGSGWRLAVMEQDNKGATITRL